jgi:hypothetical protein
MLDVIRPGSRDPSVTDRRRALVATAALTETLQHRDLAGSIDTDSVSREFTVGMAHGYAQRGTGGATAMTNAGIVSMRAGLDDKVWRSRLAADERNPYRTQAAWALISSLAKDTHQTSGRVMKGLLRPGKWQAMADMIIDSRMRVAETPTSQLILDFNAAVATSDFNALYSDTDLGNIKARVATPEQFGTLRQTLATALRQHFESVLDESPGNRIAATALGQNTGMTPTGVASRIMRTFMSKLPPAPDPQAPSPELRDAQVREAVARAQIAELELTRLQEMTGGGVAKPGPGTSGSQGPGVVPPVAETDARQARAGHLRGTTSQIGG